MAPARPQDGMKTPGGLRARRRPRGPAPLRSRCPRRFSTVPHFTGISDRIFELAYLAIGYRWAVIANHSVAGGRQRHSCHVQLFRYSAVRREPLAHLLEFLLNLPRVNHEVVRR